MTRSARIIFLPRPQRSGAQEEHESMGRQLDIGHSEFWKSFRELSPVEQLDHREYATRLQHAHRFLQGSRPIDLRNVMEHEARYHNVERVVRERQRARITVHDDDTIQYAQFSDWHNELLDVAREDGDYTGERFWQGMDLSTLSSVRL